MPTFRAVFEFDAPDKILAWQRARLFENRLLPAINLVSVEEEYRTFITVDEPKDEVTDPLPFEHIPNR